MGAHQFVDLLIRAVPKTFRSQILFVRNILLSEGTFSFVERISFDSSIYSTIFGPTSIRHRIFDDLLRDVFILENYSSNASTPRFRVDTMLSGGFIDFSIHNGFCAFEFLHNMFSEGLILRNIDLLFHLIDSFRGNLPRRLPCFRCTVFHHFSTVCNNQQTVYSVHPLHFEEDGSLKPPWTPIIIHVLVNDDRWRYPISSVEDLIWVPAVKSVEHDFFSTEVNILL